MIPSKLNAPCASVCMVATTLRPVPFIRCTVTPLIARSPSSQTVSALLSSQTAPRSEHRRTTPASAVETTSPE